MGGRGGRRHDEANHRLVRCTNRPVLILELPGLVEIQESLPILQRILQQTSAFP